MLFGIIGCNTRDIAKDEKYFWIDYGRVLKLYESSKENKRISDELYSSMGAVLNEIRDDFYDDAGRERMLEVIEKGLESFREERSKTPLKRENRKRVPDVAIDEKTRAV